MTQTRHAKLVDTSLGVPSVAEAEAFWERLGLEAVKRSEPNVVPWVQMRDPETGQKLCLIQSNFTPYAIAFEASDFDAALADLQSKGCTVQSQGDNPENGFRWALCLGTGNVPVLLGSE